MRFDPSYSSPSWLQVTAGDDDDDDDNLVVFPLCTMSKDPVWK